MLRLAGVLALALVASCTIVFNSADLPRRSDAAIVIDADLPDGRVADAVIFDVNPGGLTLSSVEPTSLVEGTGSDGGRPIVVLVHGSNIDEAATLKIVAGADAVPIGLVAGTAVVSNDHSMIAVPVTVPVIGNLGKGQQLHLLAKVSQAGAAAQTLDVTVDGLPELSTSGSTDGAAVTAGGPYSKATLSAATHFTGKAAVHVRVTGGITVSAAIDVDSKGQLAGPGGCDGGTGTMAGGCGVGVGGNGNSGFSGAAGGGGGFGADGHPGTGSSGNGGGGVVTGEPMLVKLDYNAGEDGNRGNGGGGGGGGTLGTAGVGGGGGGTLELTAGGTIVVSGAGALSSKGGDGTKGSGVTPGGDGGAGAGGAILVRSGGGVTASGQWITAPAGAIGGTKGGAGAIGRVRIDSPASPSATVASMADPTAAQGPSWAAGATGAPVIVRAAHPTLPFVGQTGRTYALVVNAVAVSPIMLTTSSTADVAVTLQPGHNTVCALADGNTGNAGNDVARTCIDVTMVP